MNLKIAKLFFFFYFSAISSNYASEKNLLVTFDLSDIVKEKETVRNIIKFTKLNNNILINNNTVLRKNLDDFLIFKFNKSYEKNCNDLSLYELDYDNFNKFKKEENIKKNKPQFNIKLIKTSNHKKLKEKNFLSRLNYFINLENINFKYIENDDENYFLMLETYINDIKLENNLEYHYDIKLGKFFEDKISKINIIYSQGLFETVKTLNFKKNKAKKIVKFNFFFHINKNELDILNKELNNVNIKINYYTENKKDFPKKNISINQFDYKNFLKINLSDITLNKSDNFYVFNFFRTDCVNNLNKIFLVNTQNFPWYKYLNNQKIKQNIVDTINSKDLNINDIVFEVNNQFYKFQNLHLKNELYKNYYLNTNVLLFKKIDSGHNSHFGKKYILETIPFITNLNYFEIDKYENIINFNFFKKNNLSQVWVYLATFIIIIIYFLVLSLIQLKKNNLFYMKNSLILFSIIYLLIVFDFFSKNTNIFLINLLLLILICKIIFFKTFKNL
jgi:hypothetical protein